MIIDANKRYNDNNIIIINVHVHLHACTFHEQDCLYVYAVIFFSGIFICEIHLVLKCSKWVMNFLSNIVVCLTYELSYLLAGRDNSAPGYKALGQWDKFYFHVHVCPGCSSL